MKRVAISSLRSNRRVALQRIFVKEQRQGLGFILLLVITLVLMVVDTRYHKLDLVRGVFQETSACFYRIVDYPFKLKSDLSHWWNSYQGLVRENQQLKEEQFQQSIRLQKLLAIESENNRLRELLDTQHQYSEDFVAVEVMNVSTGFGSQRVVLNKGSDDGVRVGQAIVNAKGILGEVVSVTQDSSQGILITDPNYGLSVEDLRSGVRAIAKGTGTEHLELQYLANSTDIEIGDQLVTSGLEGHYPFGYPVGSIEKIENTPGEAFSLITVKLKTNLTHNRYAMIIKHKQIRK